MRSALRDELKLAFETGVTAYDGNPAKLAEAVEALDVGPDTVDEEAAETALTVITEHSEMIINEATDQLIQQVDIQPTQQAQQATARPDGGSILTGTRKAKLYLSLGGFETLLAMYMYAESGAANASVVAVGAVCFFLAYFEEMHLDICVTE